MNKLPIPVICECGFSTMDTKRAYEHAMKHEQENNDRYCPDCGADLVAWASDEAFRHDLDKGKHICKKGEK